MKESIIPRDINTSGNKRNFIRVSTYILLCEKRHRREINFRCGSLYIEVVASLAYSLSSARVKYKSKPSNSDSYHFLYLISSSNLCYVEQRTKSVALTLKFKCNNKRPFKTKSCRAPIHITETSKLLDVVRSV